MEKAFLEYLGTLQDMKPDESIMKKKKNIINSQSKKENIKKRIDKLEIKKKTIRTGFINDLISVDEYRIMTEEIEKERKLQLEEIEKLDEIIEECSVDTYTYDDVKDLVTNIKLNWEHLTNKERQQFLERFVDVIKVDKSTDKVIINSVEFKR